MTKREGTMSKPPKAARSRPAPVAPIQGTERLSLADQARTAILAAILSNQFEGRLPSEDELAEMLNVSRTTVRAAVQGLERDGLITRRRAVGAHINRHVGVQSLALQRLIGFERLLRELGHEVEVEVGWERRTPREFAGVLPWEDTSKCLIIDKNYVADGQLAIALRDVVPWKNLAQTDFDEPIESLFEFSKKYCTEAIANAVVQIRPMVAEGEVTALKVPEGTPFVRLHECHYSAKANVIAWSSIDFDDSVVRLEIFRSR
jgi:GntR family transcriptional regulator